MTEAASAVTAEEQLKSTKHARYDRQLRIWGNHGQEALSNASVLLINACAVGTETLKNLVLPGIAKFTILDDKKVDPSDIGTNFFVTSERLGHSRASVTTEYLQELNPEVNGGFVEDSMESMIKNKPDFFKTFTIILVANMSMNCALKELGTLCRDHSIPLLIVRSYGFIGYYRMVVNELRITEAHEQSVGADLHLYEPFVEFQNFIKSNYPLEGLDNLPANEHAHIPWAVLLVHALAVWRRQRQSNGGDVAMEDVTGGIPLLPKTRSEKQEFKEVLQSLRRTNEDGVPLAEDNFDEALKSISRAYDDYAISSKTLEILNAPETDKLAVLVATNRETVSSSSTTGNTPPSPKLLASRQVLWWAVIRGIRDFVLQRCAEDRGDVAEEMKNVERNMGRYLPLEGKVPDMTALTNTFLKLQAVFTTRASEDVEMVKRCAVAALEEAGLSNVTIDTNYVRAMCQNARQLTMVQCANLPDEIDGTAGLKNALSGLAEDAQEESRWYLLLRAGDEFMRRYGRYPGDFTLSTNTSDNEAMVSDTTDKAEVDDSHVHLSDVEMLQACTVSVLNKLGLGNSNISLGDEAYQEFCRWGGCEMHTLSAFLGGIVSQEAIKVITEQFVPLSEGLLFNSMSQVATQFEV
eukprot:Clim_evm23s15 gene=Clim_evmTU23s15